MKENNKYLQNELVNGLAKQDEKVIKFLYEEYFSSISKLVMHNNGSMEDAKDVFQEALIVFFRKIKKSSFKLDSALQTFLYSIARLIWLKELENRRKYNMIDDTLEEFVADEKTIQDTIERNERLRLYREKFEELSENCKRILSLFLNGISISEITKIMKFSSVQHTKNRRLRCKVSLINKIRESEKFKELGNEHRSNDSGIPRW